MLGSTSKESGTSYWVGTQMPNLTGGKFGLEFNHGSNTGDHLLMVRIL
jgi:hypothetical protein